ncbi:hypothetical protein ACHAW5_003048 [Stephanodiscus triporus]|uniref:CS domain-containing protein n=1 Tax=Stephanodiscus triporus TaxID=2934178 RepID=A0ABD3P472_9STRA
MTRRGKREALALLSDVVGVGGNDGRAEDGGGNDDDDDDDDGARRRAEREGARRLVERLRGELRRLDGGGGVGDDDMGSANDAGAVAAGGGQPPPLPRQPFRDVLEAIGEGATPKSLPRRCWPLICSSRKNATRNFWPRPAGLGERRPSDHPASARRTTPVDRGVMSGMPKYQYYQDDAYMKVQILEPNVERENLTVVYTPDELTVKIKKRESAGMVEYTVIHGDLYEEVDVDGCRVVVKADKGTRRITRRPWSMQTSGGTCLSTNWGEVEKTDYEKERQAPKGMEWKNYEGKKLPMKEDD